MCPERPAHSSGIRNLVDVSCQGEVELRVSPQESTGRLLDLIVAHVRTFGAPEHAISSPKLLQSQLAFLSISLVEDG